jgi:hypothetical protein
MIMRGRSADARNRHQAGNRRAKGLDYYLDLAFEIPDGLFQILNHAQMGLSKG